MVWVSGLMGFAGRVDAVEPLPRVLLLFSYDRSGPGLINFEEAFSRELQSEGGPKVELFVDSLDGARFPGAEHEEEMAEFLVKRFAGRPPQIVVTFNDLAFRLMSARRPALFPGAEIVFIEVGRDLMEGTDADGHPTGLQIPFQVKPTLEAMLKMKPGLKEIVAVAGVAGLDRKWMESIRDESVGFSGKVKVTAWPELPYAELLDRAAKLPPDTAILYLSYFRDPGGEMIPSAAACGRLAAVSSVPVFGIYETYLGTGCVGGFVRDLSIEGVEAAGLVRRILKGEPAERIGIVDAAVSRFLFDARELERWGISEQSLPAGSEVLFRKKSLWSEHPKTVLGCVTAIVAQGALIATLLMQRRKRRRAEEGLRLSEDRYRAVVESQTELVCRFHSGGTLTFVNEAYCRAFGKTREELLGRTFFTLIPAEKHGEIRSHLRELERTSSEIMLEHQILLPDGSVGWMEWHNTAILNEAGEVEELQGIGRDVTERRRATEALAESQQRLSHALRLTLVGELTALIAHEINQPLGAILCNAKAAEMLLESGAHEEVRPILADICRDDLRASEVIHNLRTMVANKAPRLEPVRVNELVEIVLRLVAGNAQRCRTALRTELAEDLPLIVGERVQIKQMMINLLLNGMDAMAETPPELRKLTLRTNRVDGWVEIAVSDTGPGVPPEMRAQIFESFFTTKESGMGLGLAMSRSIVEAHGGEITVEDNQEGGATFRLRLPVK
jgi:PAS domain S-box-containing protein